MQSAKKAVDDLKAAIVAAKEKQKTAEDDIKKLNRDMAEFKDNKEGKIEQLKEDISKQKGALQKHAVVVKTQQKELQTATLEHGMLGYRWRRQ